MSRDDIGHDSNRSDLDRVVGEYLDSERHRTASSRKELLAQHPELADELVSFFDRQDQTEASRDAETIPPGSKPLETTSADSNDAPLNVTKRVDDTVPLDSTPQIPIQCSEGRSFGDYELLEEIARGGMGVVYRARQVHLNRVVALKMILSGQLASDEDVQRFHVEAEAAANLEHPGIVPIFEVGERDGQHFFSMAFIDGESLASKLRNGLLPNRETAALVLKIAEAISFAHSQGVVHRDLKPANILLDRDNNPRITDFGLAKRTKADSGLTATGQVLGTPSYMPPEQAAGDMNKIGPASDVYSIGAILYEALTGRPPFKAQTPVDTLLQVLDNQPVPPRLLNPETPRDLETICLKCLEKIPEQRYQSAKDLARDLRRFLEGTSISAASVNLMDRLTHVLVQSRHEEHLKGWGLALISFGMTIFITHVVIFGLSVAGFGPLVAYWMPRGFMFSLLLLILWYSRPQSLMPTNSAERLIWVVWIGYLLALGATNLVLVLGELEATLIYLFSCVLSGFGFFIMGGHVWGGSYLIGITFFLAAPLLAYCEDWSSVIFGFLWGIALLLIGNHYRHRGATTRME